MAQLIAALIGSYLIGSIPTAYLLVKWLKRIDVRTVGSGNVGATNVTRVAGMKAGAVVFLLDVAKGLAAVLLIAPWLLSELTLARQLACGFAAVLGHMFPVFLAFRGGKGVATTIGVLIGTMPLIAGVCLLVWVGCFLVWRMVSVASLAAAVTIPLTQLATHQGLPVVLLGTTMAVLILIRHRANLERLLRGSEHRFGSPRV